MMAAVMLWSISTVMTPFVAHSLTFLVTTRFVLGLGEGLGKKLIRK